MNSYELCAGCVPSVVELDDYHYGPELLYMNYYDDLHLS